MKAMKQDVNGNLVEVEELPERELTQAEMIERAEEYLRKNPGVALDLSQRLHPYEPKLGNRKYRRMLASRMRHAS